MNCMRADAVQHEGVEREPRELSRPGSVKPPSRLPFAVKIWMRGWRAARRRRRSCRRSGRCRTRSDRAPGPARRRCRRSSWRRRRRSCRRHARAGRRRSIARRRSAGNRRVAERAGDVRGQAAGGVQDLDWRAAADVRATVHSGASASGRTSDGRGASRSEISTARCPGSPSARRPTAAGSLPRDPGSRRPACRARRRGGPARRGTRTARRRCAPRARRRSRTSADPRAR